MWVLNARASAAGNDLRTRIHVEGPRPSPGQACILYIHGFNKEAGEAKLQAEHLHGLIRQEPTPALARAQLGVYLWPATRGGKRWWSVVNFPRAIEWAEEAGRMLGDYLATESWGTTVLLGHSLGAVVALEAADTCSRSRKIAGLLLTGAAVRSGDLEGKGRFRHPLADREAVMWCSSDVVLRSAFGLGAWAAAPFRRRSRPVGLTGHPVARDWNARQTEVWHHRYWREQETAAAVASTLTGTASRQSPRQLPHRSATSWPTS